MAIANIVQYETTFKMELLDPLTDKGLGIIFDIRSSESEDCKTVIRKHLDKLTQLRQKNKPVTAELIERQELEKVASFVAGWDWGDEEVYEGKGAPEFKLDNVIDILDKLGWVYSQVSQAAVGLSNFTKA